MGLRRRPCSPSGCRWARPCSSGSGAGRPRPTPTSRRAARPTGRASPPRRAPSWSCGSPSTSSRVDRADRHRRRDGHRVAPTGLTLVESDEDQEAPATVVATIPPLARRRLPRRVADAVERRPARVGGHLRLRRAERGAGGGSERDEPGPLRARRPVGRARRPRAGARRRRRRPPAAPRPGTRRALWRGRGRVSGRPGCSSSRRRAALVVALVDLVRFGAGAFTPGYAAAVGLREVALVASGRRRPAATGPGRTSSRDGRRLLVVAGLLTVSIGHFGLRGGPTWVLASTAHLLAAVLWAGSVGCARAARPARRPGWDFAAATSAGPARLPARRDRPVVVVAVTGVYLASDVVASRRRRAAHDLRPRPAAQGRAAGVVGLVALATTRALHPGGRRTGGSPAARRRPRPSACSSSRLSVVSSPQGSPPSRRARQRGAAERHRRPSGLPTSSRPWSCGRTGRVRASRSSTCSTPDARRPAPSPGVR